MIQLQYQWAKPSGGPVIMNNHNTLYAKLLPVYTRGHQSQPGNMAELMSVRYDNRGTSWPKRYLGCTGRLCGSQGWSIPTVVYFIYQVMVVLHWAEELWTLWCRPALFAQAWKTRGGHSSRLCGSQGHWWDYTPPNWCSLYNYLPVPVIS